MGFNIHGLRLVLLGHQGGVDFSKSAMLGRQRINTTFEQLQELVINEFGYDVDECELRRIYDSQYAEEFLHLLGADIVESFDASDWESATNVHDFNTPLPERWKTRYSVVFDGGALEHIFNLPIAIRNCMEMLQLGGTFFSCTPANNYVGHGFYQFSPELFYRVLSPENGFEVEHMYLHEGREAIRWYKVPDPDRVNRRVTLRNIEPTELLVQAQRKELKKPFESYPQQSDYSTMWDNSKHVSKASNNGLISRFKQRTVHSGKQLITSFFGATHNSLYTPIRIHKLTKHPVCNAPSARAGSSVNDS